MTAHELLYDDLDDLLFHFSFQEYIYTAVATIIYCIAFIVILVGFGYCSGSSWCDGRIAAGVRINSLINH